MTARAALHLDTASHATDHGAQQALNARALLTAGPLVCVAGQARALVWIRTGEVDQETHRCDDPSCPVERLGADWTALDSVEALPGQARELDLQAWLAHRAYQITRRACAGGAS